MNRKLKARRTKRVLDNLVVGGVPTTTVASAAGNTDTKALPPQSQVGILRPSPNSAGQQHLQTGPRVKEATRPLDPRSVVAAVLRRAVRDCDMEHASGTADLRRLKKSVDDTVDHLSLSLDGWRRSRRDRAKPWHSLGEDDDGEEHATQSADVVERHTTKLLLWRRLQAALTASYVGVDLTTDYSSVAEERLNRGA